MNNEYVILKVIFHVTNRLIIYTKILMLYHSLYYHRYRIVVFLLAIEEKEKRE